MIADSLLVIPASGIRISQCAMLRASLIQLQNGYATTIKRKSIGVNVLETKKLRVNGAALTERKKIATNKFGFWSF